MPIDSPKEVDTPARVEDGLGVVEAHCRPAQRRVAETSAKTVFGLRCRSSPTTWSFASVALIVSGSGRTTMGYQDIRISGDVTEAMKSLLTRMYGKVVDIEVYASTEDERYAAVAFAAVEAVERGRTMVEGVVLLLKHDLKRGKDQYQIKDLPESMGPAASFCPERILERLSPTENEYALEWREWCREELEREASRGISAAMN